MLKECEDECMKKIRSVPTNGTNGTEDLQAIVNRLRFLRHLLQSLIAIWPDKKVSATETEMGEIQKLLNGALDAMPIIKKTIAKGTQPEPNCECFFWDFFGSLVMYLIMLAADAPNPMGFSPMVNQRILPPTFPRYTKIKDRMLSMNFLEELVQRIKIACKVIFCNNYHSALVNDMRAQPYGQSFNRSLFLCFGHRTFSWTLAENQDHVYCHAACFSLYTFRIRAFALAPHRWWTSYANR